MSQIIESLPGPQGNTGLTGGPGIPGNDGVDGVDSFVQGPQGIQGPSVDITPFLPIITADKNFYVRSTGNDGNDGSANDDAHAFLTPQRAMKAASRFILADGANIQINLADGNYPAFTIPPILAVDGQSRLIVKGNSANPANVLISTLGSTAITLYNSGLVRNRLDGLKVQSNIGDGIYCFDRVYLEYKNIDFGACGGRHLFAHRSSYLECIGNYIISGGAAYHIWLEELAWCETSNFNITFLNNPIAFSGAFVFVLWQCIFLCVSTFTNVAYCTGKKFYAARNGIIDTNGTIPSANFPGSIAGTTDTQGQYI